MAASDQHYSLRWNDYTVKIVTAFQSLRDEEDFVDVTIACDGHHYSAHKMVLSACSPYFRSLLRANPCQHPIVILKDVGHHEMERLLEFMYNGEVNIAQDHLAAFLKTAESLKIRGLAGSSEDSEQQTQKELSHSYTSCLNNPGSVGEGCSPSVAFSNLSECKDDMLSTESVFAQTDSPSAKRRKRENCLVNQVDSSGQITTDANLLESTNERESGNGTLDINSDRREMKSEPPEGLSEVYGDADMGNGQSTDGMDQRSMVYPIGSMPGPSVSAMSGQQEGMSLGNQDSGGAPDETESSHLLPNNSSSSILSALGNFPWTSSNQVNRTTADNQCLICLKSFSNRGSMTRHLRDQHLQPGATVMCDICGKICKNRNCLITHRSVAHSTRRRNRTSNQINLLAEASSPETLSKLFQLQQEASTGQSLI